MVVPPAHSFECDRNITNMGRSKTVRQNRKIEYEEKKEFFQRLQSRFIPVKITDKQWADCLMNGEVYFRPLMEFSDYYSEKSEHNSRGELIDDFRFDSLEGLCYATNDVERSEIAQMFEPGLRSKLKGILQIDTGSIPYFKVFCMYCLEYDLFRDDFRKPNPKISEFGNTAVVFRDFNMFLDRVYTALQELYSDLFVPMCNRVHYLDYNKLEGIVPFFEKRKKYEYQNELRIAFSELGTQVGELFETRIMREPVKLHIGSIRDIAYELPVNDFLSLLGIYGNELCWPTSVNPNHPSFFDECVKRTHELIEKNTKSGIEPLNQETVERIGLLCEE